MINKVNELIDRNNKPTPDKYRKIGKSIALLGTLLQVALAGLSLSNIYIVIGIAVLQWLGQTITDFYTDESADKQA